MRLVGCEIKELWSEKWMLVYEIEERWWCDPVSVSRRHNMRGEDFYGAGDL